MLNGPAPGLDDLATALTQLAPFEVTQAPTDIAFKGYNGTHLQLSVPADIDTTRDNFTGCQDGEIHSWIAENNDGSFYGYNAAPGRTDDYWILDVDGTRLVLITHTSPTSPQDDLDQLQTIIDSIRVVPAIEA